MVADAEDMIQYQGREGARKEGEACEGGRGRGREQVQQAQQVQGPGTSSLPAIKGEAAGGAVARVTVGIGHFAAEGVLHAIHARHAAELNAARAQLQRQQAMCTALSEMLRASHSFQAFELKAQLQQQQAMQAAKSAEHNATRAYQAALLKDARAQLQQQQDANGAAVAELQRCKLASEQQAVQRQVCCKCLLVWQELGSCVTPCPACLPHLCCDYVHLCSV